MTGDTHNQARELIALGDALSDTEQIWLRAHLEECGSCRDYADATSQIVRELRSVSVTADARLVRATQMRVRFHAARLRETRERMWLVGLACLGVGLSSTLTLPLVWRLCAWIGEQAGVPPLVWQTGFLFFFIAPALVVGVLFLARGTNHRGGSRQW